MNVIDIAGKRAEAAEIARRRPDAILPLEGQRRRKDWQVAVCLMVCVFGALAFLLLLQGGERVMCSVTKPPRPSYCPTQVAK